VALANFISCWSRPDITYTVNKLCKYMANPGDAHWRVLKHLIRYLAATRHDGICYDFGEEEKRPPNLPKGLHGFTDSSFADCVDTGRSTLAYVFFYGPAIISWYSKLNSYVTTCTNHAEYNALAMGAKEAEWQVLLFNQLAAGNAHTPVPIMVDNSGIISMVFNPVDHQSNKHVRIGCHYTRELTENKTIAPLRVPTELNIADLFTKSLAAPTFKRLSGHFMSRSQTAVACMFRTTTPLTSTITLPNDENLNQDETASLGKTGPTSTQ
jgi:hypothetical protein